MNVFTVLMWKHYIIRKRHMGMTILELFTPLFLLLPLIGIHSGTGNIEESALKSPPTAPHLVYTPNTELTSRLIEKIADILYIPPYEPIPDKMEHSYMRSHEIKSEEELNLLQSVDGLVVFENLDGEYLPDYLNYTIHLRNPHHLTVMSRRRDYEHLDELSESFLRLQWAIDSSFIKIKANTDEDLQNITMKQLRGNAHPLINYRALSDIVFFSLIAVTFIAPILSFTQIMLRMNEDKTTGVQEISEMAGASSLMICLSQLVNSLPPSLMMAVGSSIVCLLLQIEANPLITFTGWFLHYMTVIAFAFVLSYITKTIWYTVSISMLAYLATWFPAIVFEVGSFSILGLIIKGFMPHAPFIWFIHQIFVASEIGSGIDFSSWSGEFHRFNDGSRSGSVLLSFIMQLLQIILCFLLTFYLELVRPRKFGIQRPWYFLWQKDYWVTPPMPECDNELKTNQDPAYEKYFQQHPEPALQAVDIVNLQKMYRTNTGATIYAVDNISTTFYEGEITVIIGHNGAGKSTLISIIAGLLRQTSGNVYINGLDTLTRQVDLRRQVAICPQINTLYPDLTVREHLIFFCMLRGDSMEKAQDYAEELMKQLDLYSKDTWTPEKMSHGMLRRLQVGCTLCGDANLLLLDEPTTGLDVEARREIWDILLTLRGHRTVIMSTHYMEEADILGDRILGLHSGILRCYATPEYLKKAIGAGFRLSITTRQLPDLHMISSVMREMSPDAELGDRILRTLVYEISPATDMECLLNRLEACRSKLNIESIRIGTVTMEEVFMKLCSDVCIDAFHEGVPFLKKTEEFCFDPKWPVFMTQTRELFMRQIDFSLSKLVPFILLQFLCPLALCLIITHVLNNPHYLAYLKMDLNMYNEVDAPVATYDISSSGDLGEIIDQLKIAYPHLILRQAKDKTGHHNCDCDKCRSQKRSFSRDIIDVYVDDHQAKLNYDSTVKHSASVGLNLLSNIIAAQHLGPTFEPVITMRVIYGYFDWKKPKSELYCYMFASLSVYIILSAAMNDVMLPYRERMAYTRYLHVKAGCPSLLYWLVTLTYHMAHYLLLHCSGTIIAATILEKDDTLDNVETMIAYLLALILCGLSFFTFVYVLTYFCHEKTIGLVVLLHLIYFGMYAHLLKFAFESLDINHGMLSLVDNLSMFLPMYIFVLSIKRLTNSARYNQMCLYYHQFCSQAQEPLGYPSDVCCDRSMGYGHWFSPYGISSDGMGVPLLINAAQIIVFTSLVWLLEYQQLEKVWNEMKNRRAYPLPVRKYDNPDVFAEKENVRTTIEKPIETIKETMLVSRCWKLYLLSFRCIFFGLKDINFSLRRGECLGLTGINSSGKTTVFKVLTRYDLLTKGNIYGNCYFINKDPDNYLHSLGYSHQTFGMDFFRSSETNLRTLLAFRGLTAADVECETNTWLKIIGMDESKSYMVSCLSSGMRQRLSAVTALSGGAPVLLMDEPTNGLDPAARRLIWEALEHSLCYGRSLVLASHNMEEVERLCNNFTILDEGEMSMLCTPTHFRLSYARGHTVLIKLRVISVVTDTGLTRVETLKEKLAAEFKSPLRDEHLTCLRYIVAARLHYSEVYCKVYGLSQEFEDVVEDFSVFDGTLEDGFIQYVQDSRFTVRQALTW